jgi:hypothetical protein
VQKGKEHIFFDQRLHRRPFSIKNRFFPEIDFCLQLCDGREEQARSEETEEEDQQDEQVSTVSLKKEVKDLSGKLSQVIGVVKKLTNQTSSSGILTPPASSRKRQAHNQLRAT